MQWLEEFNWLAYSEIHEGSLCKWCVAFAPNAVGPCVACTCNRARLRGRNGGNCPGPPTKRGLPWSHWFVSNKILVWKIFVIQKRYKNTTLPLYSYLARSIRSPQQQLISLQVWLSASFSNRYWIAYKYFQFCSMQIHLISLVTFS